MEAIRYLKRGEIGQFVYQDRWGDPYQGLTGA